MMKTTLLRVVLLGLLTKPLIVLSQNPTIIHNTWSSRAPLPIALYSPAVGVLGGQIYVVGGITSQGTILPYTQIYDPAANTWSTGVSLPTPVYQASAAVVKNVLYVIGGLTAPGTVTNAVWAYEPRTKTWSSKTPIPMARAQAGAVVENNVIYVMGGGNGYRAFNDVESYNPATNAWTQEAPMGWFYTDFAAGLMGNRLTGFTIVVTDGGYFGEVYGGTEGYNASTNTWNTGLAGDTAARFGTCSGSTGPQLYVAGGYNSTGVLTLTEAFSLSKNAWKTRAPMPQAEVLGGSAVYKGLLYCIGGLDTGGNTLNTVQVYQP